MFDDIPIEIKIYLDEKFKDKWPDVTKSEIKMYLMNELNLRGKYARSIAERYLSYLSFLDFLKINNMNESEYLKSIQSESIQFAMDSFKKIFTKGDKK